MLFVADELRRAGEFARSGRKDLAADLLNQLQENFPAEAADLPDTAAVMLGLGRCDEAERLLLQGMRRFPDNRTFQEFYGRAADVRGDLPERLRRWHRFRRRFPAYRMAFIMEAKALSSAGDLAASEKVWAEAVALLPDDLDLAIEYAGVAEARQDWQEAIKRWSRVKTHFRTSLGARRTALALIKLGLEAEADVELKRARLRFPFDADVIQEQAALAERNGDIAQALATWEALRAAFPNLQSGYSEAVRLLQKEAKHDIAHALEVEASKHTFQKK